MPDLCRIVHLILVNIGKHDEVRPGYFFGSSGFLIFELRLARKLADQDSLDFHSAHVVSSGFGGLEIGRGVCGLWNSGAIIRIATRFDAHTIRHPATRVVTEQRHESPPALSSFSHWRMSRHPLSRVASPRASRSLYRSSRAARALSLGHMSCRAALSHNSQVSGRRHANEGAASWPSACIMLALCSSA